MSVHRQPSRRYINYAAYTILAVTLLLLMLPQIVGKGLVYGLTRVGAGAVSVGNVDINLFTGRLALDELLIYHSGARVLRLGHGELELDWHTLWSQRIQLRKLLLQNLSLTVEQPTEATLRIAGFTLPDSDNKSPPHAIEEQTRSWGYGIEQLVMQNNTIDYIRPGLTQSLTVNRLEAGPLHTWNTDAFSQLSADIGFNDATVSIDASAAPFARQPVAKLKLRLYTLQLATLQPLLPTTSPKLNGSLSAAVELEAEQNEAAYRIQQSGTVSLSRPVVELQQQSIGGETVSWQGKSSVLFSGQDFTATLEGDLNAKELAIALPTNRLSLSSRELSWQGRTRYTTRQDAPDLIGESNLALRNIAVAFSHDAAAHTQLSQLRLKDVALNGIDDLKIGEIRLSGLKTSLRQSAQGLEPLQSHLAARPAQANEPVAESGNTAAGGNDARIRIGAILLDGDNNIRFEDDTTKPRFEQSLLVTHISIGPLDSQAPAQAAPFKLETTLGEHSSLSAKGNVTPFAEPPQIQLDASLKNYEMPPLSPYLVRQLGYKINSGQLDSKLQLAVADNALKGEIQIKARQLDMEPEDPARIEKFEQQSSMPINTALGLLRDKENNISLKIPLSGDLSDPKFDISDAINTALANTMRSAAVSYLKYLLQPYSSVISLVQLAGKAGGSVQLEPVVFTAGMAEPNQEMEGYIEKLAELFGKRENLQLRLCGIATTDDLLALSKGKSKTIPEEGDPALEALAKNRAENIKTILVDRYGVAPERLFICHPVLDSAEGALPRVRLQL